jgi:hypothetical protein
MAAFGQFFIKPIQNSKNIPLELFWFSHREWITTTYIVSNKLQEQKDRMIIILVSSQSFNISHSIS